VSSTAYVILALPPGGGLHTIPAGSHLPAANVTARQRCSDLGKGAIAFVREGSDPLAGRVLATFLNTGQGLPMMDPPAPIAGGAA
jgi:hypothetical protein